jgi:hypothetical protein
MESEKKEVVQGKKDIWIGMGMQSVQDLGTDNPDLMITMSNNGPARQIEYYITDQKSYPSFTGVLREGTVITFRLGDCGKGKFLVLTNKDGQEANVSLKW